MPMRLPVQSTSSLHVFAVLAQFNFSKRQKLTHGAMITLAPGTGSSVPSIDAGTWASHSSNSPESVEAREEYHEPAWLATLVVMLSVDCKGN